MQSFGMLFRAVPARRLLRAALLLGAFSGLFLVPPAGLGDPSPARFTNLQVLPEDASAAEVFQVMKLMTRALGSECRYCHLSATRDFGSDALELKRKARAMMLLEQARRPDLSWRDPPADLCIECHQGQQRPASAVKVTTD